MQAIDTESNFEHDRGRGPAIGRGIRDAVEQRAEAEGREDKPWQVEAPWVGRAALTQQKERQEEASNADGHVQIEDQTPVCVLHNIATECWAKSRGEQNRDPQRYPLIFLVLAAAALIVDVIGLIISRPAVVQTEVKSSTS